MSLLVLLAIVLLIIAGHQLLRIIELSRGLKKTKEWQITDTDNNMMGKAMLAFMILFFVFFFWQVERWMDRSLPPAASEHGVLIDDLWDANMWLITVIFIITNFVLFWFAYKYRGNSKNKAVYYPHNNKLEMLWTVVPAVALTFIIIFGLKYWNEIMDDAKEPNRVTIELYAKQFDWSARYTGKDGKLGETDYRQIDGGNSVGMDTTDVAGFDDQIVKNEFHIPVGREIELVMRSRDVIHSAYLPHFRAQMNCVPGMITYFKFKPTKTTAEMRKDPYTIMMMAGINKARALENKEPIEFDYLLLCNKICGVSHFNMQMNVIVDTEEDYQAWIAKQKAFKTVASKN
ncbi:cytochrome c oxidase subunit II [Aurantibacillus circumpalustris]|uniref:cytochrome c oxidase subunit II n=1 Tax=Aurantibacillus circumpalustris TaxID=3036359 RepID=UPI00295BC866|nr:cytochrome c oxidase subunit II [Aurantibacillus circumpalustris]